MSSPGVVTRWPVSVAPMMDRTDRHFRAFIRRISSEVLLYSEMVTTSAVLHGNREHLLGFSAQENPLALQLGGDDPQALADCAVIAQGFGYDEVNLNAGCPSNRVQKAHFGACLMKVPEKVAEAVLAMRAAVDIPVTVKHRIGVDDVDQYRDLVRFVEIVADAGAQRFSIHARKAWLSGLSPKENRNIPPLRYEDVYRLKRENPRFIVEINGGVSNVRQVKNHLENVDGVMIGRAAYDDPFLLATVDQEFYGSNSAPSTRREIIEATISYAELWLQRGLQMGRIARHLIGLMKGCQGARTWRRILSEGSNKPEAGPEVLLSALEAAPKAVLDERP
jgi:tRNA-dihydrouridine synthase A